MPAFGRVVAISFDGDDTLWDFQRLMRRALGYVVEELHRLAPIAAAEVTLDTLVSHRRQTATELRGRITNLDQIRRAAFERTLREIGVRSDDLAERLNTVYLEHRFEDVELFDDVVPTLSALQGRYKLGIVSNGNSYPEGSGLAGRFQFVVFSEQHGVEKPDPRLFRIAHREAGCRETEWLHVGDSLLDDVAGAQGAGGRAVWINRTGRSNDTAVKPDFEVSSLTEVVELCQQVR